MPFPPAVAERLASTYEELMWLANRPHVTPRQARAWYSQVLAIPMAPKVRRFTGRVSRKAIENINEKLVLEHYNRLSHSLSRLIETHIEQGINDPTPFLVLIEQCEQVNITTDEENHRVQDAAGDYEAANIELVEWNTLSAQDRAFLWQTKLRGKVSNATDYAPQTEA
jgi:hypothetical protein